MRYLYSVKVNKYSGSFNNINYPYAKLCVPDIIKNISVKIFNLMEKIKQTRQVIWLETCKCVCRLTSSICNSRQIWNTDKCRYECREDLIDKEICDKVFTWNPSNCNCECDKSCGIGEYLDYKSCVCRNTLVDKLVEEYTDRIDLLDIQNENSSSSQHKKSPKLFF